MTIKKSIREAIRRWHPDKFKQKMGHRIVKVEFMEVMGKVTYVAQALNEFGMAKWLLCSIQLICFTLTNRRILSYLSINLSVSKSTTPCYCSCCYLPSSASAWVGWRRLSQASSPTWYLSRWLMTHSQHLTLLTAVRSWRPQLCWGRPLSLVGSQHRPLCRAGRWAWPQPLLHCGRGVGPGPGGGHRAAETCRDCLYSSILQQ